MSPPGPVAARSRRRGPWMRWFPSPPEPGVSREEVSRRDALVLERSTTDGDAGWNLFLERFAAAIYRQTCAFATGHDERMDLFVHVAERLRADDMKRIRAFRRRPEAPCTFRTYLTVVVRNLILDYLRSARGRTRAFKRIADLDLVDREIYERRVCERRPVEEVRQFLGRHRVPLGYDEIVERANRLESHLSANQRWRLLSRLVAHRRHLAIDPTQEVAAMGGRQIPLPGRGRDPESMLGARAAEKAFRTAIARVHPRKRLALALRFKDGLKIREVARVMHATEKQVEHWVHDGTAAIRRHLAEHGVTRDDLGPDQLSELWRAREA